MKNSELVKQQLRKYKLNLARISFLENQLNRLTPEDHDDYIEYKMLKPGYQGAVPKFVLENGEEVAALNNVEETAHEYKNKCAEEYNKAAAEIKKELRELKYYTSMVEDGLETLGRVDEKYRIIIERCYVNGIRMEDIAETLHVSRSRCYEMCNEGVTIMTRVIFGRDAV